jgi:homogentisate 1,2-dioxygenase
METKKEARDRKMNKSEETVYIGLDVSISFFEEVEQAVERHGYLSRTNWLRDLLMTAVNNGINTHPAEERTWRVYLGSETTGFLPSIRNLRHHNVDITAASCEGVTCIPEKGKPERSLEFRAADGGLVAYFESGRWKLVTEVGKVQYVSKGKLQK